MRTLRRECLDHFLPLSEQHVRAVLAEFATYYNRDRPHRSLGLLTPIPSHRPVAGKVFTRPVLGGLHHVYQQAAWTRLRLLPPYNPLVGGRIAEWADGARRVGGRRSGLTDVDSETGKVVVRGKCEEERSCSLPRLAPRAKARDQLIVGSSPSSSWQVEQRTDDGVDDVRSMDSDHGDGSARMPTGSPARGAHVIVDATSDWAIAILERHRRRAGTSISWAASRFRRIRSGGGRRGSERSGSGEEEPQ